MIPAQVMAGIFADKFKIEVESACFEGLQLEDEINHRPRGVAVLEIINRLPRRA